MLEGLLDGAPKDHVTIAWLLDSLRERSFGMVMLIMSIIGIAPGASLFVGILMAIPTVQMMLGRESPAFPRVLSNRRVPTSKVARLVDRIVPVLRRAERFIRPRWRMPSTAAKRAVGFVVFVLSATLLAPLPFSQFVPIFVMILIAFAYLEEDGILLCIGLAAAIASVALTLAALWGAWAGVDFLEGV
ncbi:MAG: exopolysaccharide biosynthesis protein [Alphaproteobacteria bacterium]|nr:exopolysaccharide biosynthesis protein [Alphaproteobacteria bacterium]